MYVCMYVFIYLFIYLFIHLVQFSVSSASTHVSTWKILTTIQTQEQENKAKKQEVNKGLLNKSVIPM